MAGGDERNEHLEEVVGALVARRMEESLTRVEEALSAWRRGEMDLFSAHAETLRHQGRMAALSARVARAEMEGSERLLRDAFDAGLVGREAFLELAGRAPEEVEPFPSLDAEAQPFLARGMTPPLPEKRAVVERLLGAGAVLLHLDARRPGVKVPPAHAADPRLVLRIGYGLKPPIPDLTVDGDGVTATLSFRGTLFRCVVPWAAIYAVVGEDGRGLVWPGDVPPEAESRPGGGDDEGGGSGGGGAGGADGGDAGGGGAGGGNPSKPRRGHLRLV